MPFRLGATAIMANGVVYAVGGGMRRSVVAIDAATGTLLWVHQEDEGLRAEFAPRIGSGRGVSYWTDGRGDERIILLTGELLHLVDLLGDFLFRLASELRDIVPGLLPRFWGKQNTRQGAQRGPSRHSDRHIFLIDHSHSFYLNWILDLGLRPGRG